MSVQVRKTVTVLFADVVGSTTLTEAHDPEAVRAAMGRYFECARAVLEEHGGTVEKFIGDAVMAVFGIPEMHEDDALRAVRAAVQLRARLGTLELPVPLHVRIGVTTGEVVTGEGETFATGDAVNVAARLQTAADQDEILIGDETRRLVAAAITAEPRGALELKGKAAPVATYRLLDVAPDAPGFARRSDAPFVGRERELRTLLDELARATEERTCRLAVVTADAGVGKSRLMRELARSVGDLQVLVGRCLSYGEGITYWPLREILDQLGGRSLRPAIAGLVGEQAADAVLGAVGLGPVTAQSGEIHWAVRRLLEVTAPVVVILDDLHWAEPMFLDLVDYMQAFVQDAPVLVVATGRPELLDMRPAWRGYALELAPLGEAETGDLVDALAGALGPGMKDRIVDAAEGNPLFVEQLLAFAEDSGELVVPPTIHALLASRIDALSDEEREVVQAASVEGRVFHRGAVEALVPDELRPAVLTQLLSLVRRRLVRPASSLFPDDDGFRFAHALVLDAAYRAAPKADRAAAHERYAAWLRRVARDRDDLEEIVAYHLEQAALLGGELGSPRPELALEAGTLLATAASRAVGRGDVGAAAGVLTRAASLLPPSPERVSALALLGFVAIQVGDFPKALATVEEALAAAEGDDAGRARASLIQTWMRMLASDLPYEEARVRLEEAIATLRAAADDWWTARGLIIVANTCAAEARFGPAVPMLLTILDLPDAMADPALRAEMLFWIGASLMLGPVEVAAARAQIEELGRNAGTPLEQAWRDFPLGMLAAYEGRYDEARELLTRSRSAMRDAGAGIYYAANAIFVGWMEVMAGEHEASLELLDEAWEILGAAGERGLRSSVGLQRATALWALGRDAEAEALAAEAIELTGEQDASAQFHHRGILARLRSRAGEHAAALELARESVAIAEGTDSAWHRAEAQLFLLEVAAGAGADDERRVAAAELLRLVDAHGLTAYRDRALALAD